MFKRFLVPKNPRVPIFSPIGAISENHVYMYIYIYVYIYTSDNFVSMFKRFLVPKNPRVPYFSPIVATVEDFQIPKFCPKTPTASRHRLLSLSFLEAKNEPRLSHVFVSEFVTQQEGRILK